MPNRKNTEVNDNIFKHLVKTQYTTPEDGTYSRDIIDPIKNNAELLQELIDKIDSLNRKLDLIFGDHVLMNGRFENIRS